MKTNHEVDYDVDDRLVGVEIQFEKDRALRAKYEMLKSLLPQIGSLESGRHLRQGEGAWILDFGGFAAIVGPTTWDPVCFEVHGGIYSSWKERGGVLGPLGRPISDEADYHGPDARPGDRWSRFENGTIVWRADTWQTEVRVNLWHDEFDGTAIDSSKWSFEIGTGNNGWGNNEKEYYTDRPENAYVKDGILHIRAVKESYQGSDYTSARMVTKGKFSFTYGVVEARIALPAGKGIWPAFWMLGGNIDSVGWPACGEIDIIEAINDENVVYGTCHWFNNGHAQHGKSTADFYGASFPLDVTKFHVYKLTWNNQLITTYVDGFKYNEMSIANNAGGTDAFHKPFYLILNVAVGGDWPGFEIDDSQFPNEMLVDYIRVSQLP